ncbi:MAG: transposase [Rikenellaceae bacterium]
MATRRKFSASFKAKVAMEAMKEQATLAELSHKYEVSVSQISQWKHEVISNMDKIFGGRAERESFDKDLQIQRLQSKVGELVLERDFLEDACKKVGLK